MSPLSTPEYPPTKVVEVRRALRAIIAETTEKVPARDAFLSFEKLRSNRRLSYEEALTIAGPPNARWVTAVFDFIGSR
jgi:hypothetical protein